MLNPGRLEIESALKNMIAVLKENAITGVEWKYNGIHEYLHVGPKYVCMIKIVQIF